VYCPKKLAKPLLEQQESISASNHYAQVTQQTEYEMFQLWKLRRPLSWTLPNQDSTPCIMIYIASQHFVVQQVV